MDKSKQREEKQSKRKDPNEARIKGKECKNWHKLGKKKKKKKRHYSYFSISLPSQKNIQEEK